MKITQEKKGIYAKDGAYREHFKEGKRILAFITFEGNEKGYSYAFGTPKQKGGYICFMGNKRPLTLEEARARVFESLIY